jgi:MFS family permease
MLGSLACAFVPSFWTLVVFRIIMGAGEASIITLTGPFIDDVAPASEKTLWFGILNVVSHAFSLHAGHAHNKWS